MINKVQTGHLAYNLDPQDMLLSSSILMLEEGF